MQHNLIDSRSGNKNLHILETIGEIRIWAEYGLYYGIVNFISYYNAIVAIKRDASVLRICRLKYLGVTCVYYGICNLFSNGSTKCYKYKYREKANEKQR